MGEVVWGRQGTHLYFGTPRVRYGEFGTEYVGFARRESWDISAAYKMLE